MKKSKFILTAALLSGLFSSVFAITCPKPEDIYINGNYLEAPGGWVGYALYNYLPNKFLGAVADPDINSAGRLVLGSCKYATVESNYYVFVDNSKYNNPIIINTNSDNWLSVHAGSYLCDHDLSTSDFTVDSCDFELPPSN